MDELIKLLVETGQCGALAGFLALCLGYQTYRIGKLEVMRERDRKQIVADAEARTAAANAQVAANKELVRLLERRRVPREGG